MYKFMDVQDAISVCHISYFNVDVLEVKILI